MQVIESNSLSSAGGMETYYFVLFVNIFVYVEVSYVVSIISW